MGNISDALQILQRVIEYKIASRDTLKTALRYASDRDQPMLETFYNEQVETLKRIPVLFKKLRFDSPHIPGNDSVTEMMDGTFIEAAAGASGEDMDFRRAALRVEERAIQLMKKPLLERQLSPDICKLLEENLLAAEIHATQLRKMIGRG